MIEENDNYKVTFYKQKQKTVEHITLNTFR